MRSLSTLVLVLVGHLGAVSAATAWSSQGHRLITATGVDVPELSGLEWSEAEKAAIVRAAVQPDLMRPRELPQLRAIEAPRHFLDLELLQGHALPETYWEYVSLLTRIAESGDGKGLLRPGGDVTQIGTLPYAIVEGTQRLAAIFAQLRSRPKDSGLRLMAAHQAGLVAHYAQDLCQPLHTTVHHDGRALKDGSSPQTGIHWRVDSLIQFVSLRGQIDLEGSPRVLDPLFPAILAALEESHSQVDRVYKLARRPGVLQGEGRIDPRLVEFAADRYRKAVGLTADLIQTAWHLSAHVRLPEWAQQRKPSGSDS